MDRVQNFRSNIAGVIAAYEGQTFKIGERDCCLFGADIIKAQTGLDPAANYRGKYKTIKGGVKLWQADGYTDQADYLSKNFKPVEPAFVRMGDLALIETSDLNGIGFSVGVVAGHFIIGIGPKGLSRLPIFQAKQFYRVGN